LVINIKNLATCFDSLNHPQANSENTVWVHSAGVHTYTAYRVLGGSIKKKNTKFGMKVNFYLELEWKSQPVTDFKELTIIHHNIQKNNIIFV